VGFRVVLVVNPKMLVKGLPENIKATGADMSMYTEAQTEDELLSLCSDADCIVTHQSYFPFTPRVFKGLPRCKFLITASVGYDALDVTAATESGIGIVNLRGFCAEELAEHAMALMLACARYTGILNTQIREGRPTSRQSDPAGRFMTILKGKTLGIIGFGNAGKMLVPKAKGFEMPILAYDPFIAAHIFEDMGVTSVSLDRLLEESDFVAIHADLNSTSFHLIGLEQLQKMKREAFIVNTARGAIIDQQALVTALSKEYIAGAGLDVVESEPLQSDNPLLKFENVVFTGHRAGSSRESAVIWAIRPAEEVSRMMRGEWPVSLVNPEVKERYTAKWGSLSLPRE
jgi:D-3-phosphoglycerate dehydrogenase / 2-oxoglutarate reductase